MSALYDKAVLDFEAGSKDDATYNDFARGLDYRNGWRAARFAAESRAERAAPPSPPVPDLLQAAPQEGPTAAPEIRPDEVVRTVVEPSPAPEAPVLTLEPVPPDLVLAPAEEPYAYDERPKGPKPPYRVPLMTEIARIPWNGFKACSTFSGCGGSSLGYKLDGSPPCSSFSTAGIREEGWGRVKKYSDSEQRTDDLFFEFVRLLDGLQPKTFVAENVVGLTIGTAKDMLGEGQTDMFETQDDTILHKLMDCGYRVGFHIVNGAEQGVPQNRRRVIFVGIRKDLAKVHDLEPRWPQPLGWSYTVRDAIPWIDGKIPNPFPVEPASDISRYAVGKEWDNLKPGEQSEKYFSEVKVHPEAACPTICASHGSGSIASIVHPFEKRKFSIAELKRLGGFPDDFVLTGDYQQQWERIGRAVPPIMMAQVAATVRDEILRRIPR